ncbi:MAG TPA: CoA-binding protein [Acidimicrobiales bacterium]|nr:CoA-binding protein [Acidimicrobiales bacterium]
MPDVLARARSILVIDWPTREVPETLARAGYEVVVHGGPGPEDYVAYEVAGGEVVERRVGQAPAHADLVWTYRPLAELPEIVELAQAAGATTVWVHSGLAGEGVKDPAGCWLPAAEAAAARTTVEAAGLEYLDQPWIVDAVRELGRIS